MLAQESCHICICNTCTVYREHVWLRAGGLAIGLAFGLVTIQLLKALKWRGLAQPPQELSLSVAMAYLCFYAANGPGTGHCSAALLGLFQA